MDELTAWSRDLTVEVGGHGVVSHTGSAALRLPADRTGLTGALSRALRRRGFTPVHDRGRVLADTAVLIADGGRVMSDLAVLRDQGELFGSVASDPTLWRALEEIGPDQWCGQPRDATDRSSCPVDCPVAAGPAAGCRCASCRYPTRRSRRLSMPCRSSPSSGPTTTSTPR